MTDHERHRGSETIRVFNLDSPSLRGSQRKALKQYLAREVGLIEALMGFDEEDRQVFIDEEIEATRWDPFWTTIRHFFEKLD
jgi:hypothetical protein